MKLIADVLALLRSVRVECRQVAVPRALVAAGVLFSVFGVLSLVTGIISFGREAAESVRLNRLRTELLHSRQENRALRQLLTEFGERVTTLELLAEEVQGVARIAGQGVDRPVPTKVHFAQLVTPGTAAPRWAARRKASETIDRQIDKLARLYTEGYWRLSYTPSLWPVEGILADRFGVIEKRLGLGGSSFHRGIDITARTGSPVLAPADGTVASTLHRSDYGKTIVLRHRYGISTVYAHLSAFQVDPGERVRRGQVIGFVGNTGRSTGSHLHYEVRVGNVPVDPMRYISRQVQNRLPRTVGLSGNRPFWE